MSDVHFNNNTDIILEEFREQIDVALETIGLVAEGYAKRLCPVDTGRLRNSITHTTDDEAAYIGTNVEYAVYVEMGTVNTPAQPYLKPAVTDHVNEYQRVVQNALKGS